MNCFPIVFPYLLIFGYLLQAPDNANFFWISLKVRVIGSKLNGEQRIFPIHGISYISLDRIGRIAMIAIKSNEHRSSLLIQSTSLYGHPRLNTDTSLSLSYYSLLLCPWGKKGLTFSLNSRSEEHTSELQSPT